MAADAAAQAGTHLFEFKKHGLRILSSDCIRNFVPKDKGLVPRPPWKVSGRSVGNDSVDISRMGTHINRLSVSP